MQSYKLIDLVKFFNTHKSFPLKMCRSTLSEKPLVTKGFKSRIKEEKMRGAMGEVNKMTSVLWAMELTYAMQVIIKLIKF